MTELEMKRLQRQRFIDAARDAGCREDEAVLDEKLKKVLRPPKGEKEKPSR